MLWFMMLITIIIIIICLIFYKIYKNNYISAMYFGEFSVEKKTRPHCPFSVTNFGFKIKMVNSISFIYDIRSVLWLKGWRVHIIVLYPYQSSHSIGCCVLTVCSCWYISRPSHYQTTFQCESFQIIHHRCELGVSHLILQTQLRLVACDMRLWH